MPAKPSGQVKTRIIHNKQKNGDIYVIERKTIYDPEKQCNRVLSSKLLSKIPKGSTKPIATRPKKSSCDEQVSTTSEITASRKHVGMMDIISHIGEVSGIDESIYSNTDLGTAQKILSLARYLLATDGQSLPGITAWQYSHPLPYEDGFSEDVYHDLFVQVGTDETLQQNFFADRCRNLQNRAVLAYDSSTISTYSENQIEARYGFNKSGDGLKTIKLLTLYSIETRQPVAFTKQPGNLPDVVTVENALKQLSVLGLGNAQIVTDNGYYSEKNLSALFQSHFDFITLVKTSLKWVRPEIDRHLAEFGSMSSVCPYDPYTHGITVMMVRDFEKTRKYASKKNGLSKGDTETFHRRIYLHIYFNPSRKAQDDAEFDADILELKQQLEDGAVLEDLPQRSQHQAGKYLAVQQRGQKIRVSVDERACQEHKKYHGYFALVSNDEKDTFECLRKYRKREHVESFFQSMKQHADSSRSRVWEADTLRGRMFVQFVALCYYEYFSNQIREMKTELGIENGEPEHDTKAVLQLENRLKSWIKNTPIYLMLQWFDTIEQTKVSAKLVSKRWTTEITARDQLFLQKLGVTVS